MNTTKPESLLVVRDSQGNIIAIFNKKEGTNLLEVVSCQMISMEELELILSGKSEIKI